MKILVSVLLSIILAFAVAEPATPTDISSDNAYVSVSIEIDTPLECIRIGNPLVLRCVVNGIDAPYNIQWQYSADTEEWIDIPCNDEIYEFVLTRENVYLYYRVCVFQHN